MTGNSPGGRRGRFVTLEGIEGAGKSTQLEMLGQWLDGQGIDALLTREPGGTSTGNEIRKLLLHGGRDVPISNHTELLLIFAARRQHLDEVIRPALTGGRVVICDRFTDSTRAYQGGGRGIPRAEIDALEHWVQQGLKPDLTLLLDIDPAQGMQRAAARRGAAGNDRFEAQDAAFFERVRSVYLDIARAEPERVRLVDAARPAEAVRDDLVQALATVLKS
jgi:dTMP kinase